MYKGLREYMEVKRLDTAKQMLLSNECTPTRVSTILGYSSVRQFSMLFKKLIGVTPQDYKSANN